MQQLGRGHFQCQNRSCFEQGLVDNKVKLCLVAIWHAVIAFGFWEPQIASLPKLQYVMKGLQRATSMRGKHACLAITLMMFCELKASWVRLPYFEDTVMPWAASGFHFFGFLRIAKWWCRQIRRMTHVHLNLEDVTCTAGLTLSG